MSIKDTLPEESLLNDYMSKGDYLDVFSISLAGRQDLCDADMRRLADHAMMADISWMNTLLDLRDCVVRPLGLKTTATLSLDQVEKPLEQKGAGDRIGFFKIYRVEENEIVLGEDDWHQDFRVSLFRSQGAEPRLYASTCCKRHNPFGYAYLALILPFHKKIVNTVLDTAIKSDLPVAA